MNDLMLWMLSLEEIRSRQTWAGQPDETVIAQFADDMARTGIANVLRRLADYGRPVTPEELRMVARDFDLYPRPE